MSNILERMLTSHSRVLRYTTSLVVLSLTGTLVAFVNPAPAVALEGFSDLADAGVHRQAVESLDAEGVLAGTECAPAEFCPTAPVTRWVMAVWLVRVLDGSKPTPVTSSRFVDVSTDEWWAPYVERLAELNITQGCGSGPPRYCPDDAVTRGQMASFLVRAFDLPSGPSDMFADTGGNTHKASIEALANAEITRGCAVEPLRYCPGQTTTKAQMATFLARVLGLSVAVSRDGDFTALSSGSAHACGMREDRSITCWGGNWVAQADAPEGSYTAVAAGHEHSCAIAADKTVSCWGANWVGQGNAPSGKYIAISAGGSHTCAIRTDKTAACWGDNTVGQTEVPDEKFTTIDAGFNHSCGIAYNGTISCWGSNDDGQGDVPSGKYIAISAGGSHTCAIRTDKTINCWGGNWAGQSDAPARYVDTIAVGAAHSCAIRIDRTITCWGSIYRAGARPAGEFTAVAAGAEYTCGLRINGTVACSGVEIATLEVLSPDTEVITLDTNEQHICTITDDHAVVCWGNNSAGQADVPEGEYIAIATGSHYSCAIRIDNTVKCWGATDIAPEGEYIAITAGAFHLCAIHIDRTANCWGHNENGQAEAPTGEYIAIAAGYDHSCAVRADGTVNCWGSNWAGQANTPEGEYIAITAGTNHSCAIRADRTVNCWGSNWAGQANTPEGEYIAITAGTNHSCAIRADRTVNCWGSSENGQAEAPTGEYVAIAAGYGHSCAIRTDKTISCWGSALIVDSPDGVQTDTGFSVPTSDTCRPPGLGAGFPLPSGTVSTKGTIRVAVLFTDFPDRQAIYSTPKEMKLSLPYIEDYLSTASYGSLDVKWVILDEWLRVQHPTDHYLVTNVLEYDNIGYDVIADAIRLADKKIDFTEVDSIMVVLPSYLLGGGYATGGFMTDEGSILKSVVINSAPSELDHPPDDLPNWGPLGAHELLHNLGLADLYPYDQPLYPEAVSGMVWRKPRSVL